MSKTSKIRKLTKQLASAKKEIDCLNFSNSNLLIQTSVTPIKHVHTPPPEIRSNNWNEEQELNRIIGYVYKRIDEEYDMAFKIDPYAKMENIKFRVYMGCELIHRLQSIDGYTDFDSAMDGDLKFRGHHVEQVIAPMHLRFVRVK